MNRTVLSDCGDVFSQVVQACLRQDRRCLCYWHYTTPEVVHGFSNGCTPLILKYEMCPVRVTVAVLIEG
jgi:hypothetical protein